MSKPICDNCHKKSSPVVLDLRDKTYQKMVCLKCDRKIKNAFDLLGIHPVNDRFEDHDCRMDTHNYCKCCEEEAVQEWAMHNL
jgi:hypothetical protein